MVDVKKVFFNILQDKSINRMKIVERPSQLRMRSSNSIKIPVRGENDANM